jgi:hypothetical protein
LEIERDGALLTAARLTQLPEDSMAFEETTASQRKEVENMKITMSTRKVSTASGAWES